MYCIDEYCRNIGHNRWHSFCGGFRKSERDELRSSIENAKTKRVLDIKSVRGTAKRCAQTKSNALKNIKIRAFVAGRAGRTGPGVCYRIYAEKSFNELEAYSAAEIHRVPLESLLLQMISMGLPNARLFPFIESPPSEAIENGILSLKHHASETSTESFRTNFFKY